MHETECKHNVDNHVKYTAIAIIYSCMGGTNLR